MDKVTFKRFEIFPFPLFQQLTALMTSGDFRHQSDSNLTGCICFLLGQK